MESSLRTRRPSEASRRAPARSPSKLTKNAPRDARKSRVDDKIKKRMSMRYADISPPSQVPPLPAVPPLPTPSPISLHHARDTPRDDDSTRGPSSTPQRGAISSEDKKVLSAEDFDADAFIKAKLANSTEAELRTLQSTLRLAKDDTASDLQRSVFKNYAEFVVISKEISVLENEMHELKDLLSEFKSMPSMLHIPDPTSATSGTLSTYKRSSVADLRVLYFNQMQALHASIEGAAKFVPTTPGRHILSEMEGVYSLNTATYKVVGKVKFVILDDAVLVARRRRRNATAADSSSNEGKLVAEKCWLLNDMLVLDTKDSPNMTNVFKIRQGKEIHVYRTEAAADKKSLLAQFRQAADELTAKKRKEREGEHERRKSIWQGGDKGSVPSPMPEWMADIARKGADFLGASEADNAKEKAESDARWVGEWSDDLSVAIALREWTSAVDLVEQGQRRLSTTPALQNKLPDLTNQLTAALLSSLSMPSNKKTSCITLITLLVRLRAAAAARKTFLDMRTTAITGLMRRIRFEGDINAYVGDLSIVWFTGIKHTADWYLGSFRDNESTSALVVWVQEQLKTFAEMFRKQVYTVDVKPDVVQEAMTIAQIQGRKLLQEHGLDFRHFLDQLLVERPKESNKGRTQFSYAEHKSSRQPKISIVTSPQESNQSPFTSPSQFSPTEKGSPPIQRMPSPPSPPTSSTTPISTRRRTPAPPSAFKEPSSPRSITPPPPSAPSHPPSPHRNRSRTPVPLPSPMPMSPASELAPPASAPITGLGISVRNARTPPPPSSAGLPTALTPGSGRSGIGQFGPTRARLVDEEKDRESYSPGGRVKSVRTNPSLPPRSVKRPGSSSGLTPRSLVPQREGMF